MCQDSKGMDRKRERNPVFLGRWVDERNQQNRTPSLAIQFQFVDNSSKYQKVKPDLVGAIGLLKSGLAF